MRRTVSGSLLIALLAAAGLQACLSARYYKTLNSVAHKSAVIAEADHVSVRLGWDFYKGGADHLVVDLIFKAAVSGETLFEGRVETSSMWTNNLGHKMNESGGRLGIATWNLVRPIISVIKHGQISPASW